MTREQGDFGAGVGIAQPNKHVIGRRYRHHQPRAIG